MLFRSTAVGLAGRSVDHPDRRDERTVDRPAHTLRPRPQALRTVTVPTGLERAGDYSKSYTSLDANLKPIALYIRDPLKTGTCSATDQTACFAGNVVPTARLNKN